MCVCKYVCCVSAGGVITTMAGSKLASGNVIQLAGGAGGVQRLTLVSPQGSHVPLTTTSQRLVLATGSQVCVCVGVCVCGKVDD